LQLLACRIALRPPGKQYFGSFRLFATLVARRRLHALPSGAVGLRILALRVSQLEFEDP
jgi:hypothetical protein